MKQLLLLTLFIPALLWAQDDSKYLAGAVPVENGKVVFAKEINAPSFSKDEVYDKMLDWADGFFSEDGNRVVYSDKAKGDIAAVGQTNLVFQSTALSLDRTEMNYRVTMECENQKCIVKVAGIRYEYNVSYQREPEKYTAEEWITDDMALNKKKTKLAPICGKFRRETIDLKDQLFQSATDALGQKVLANETAPAVVPATPLTPAMTLTGELKEVPVAQFSDNWNSQLQNGRITLTANDEEIEIKAENWGGFGKLFNKNVAYLLIAQDRIALSALMEQCSEYKISFYAQGASQPTAVIECKKSMNQKMTAEDLKSLNIQADSNKSYTMYTGEITRTQLRQ